MCKSTSRINMVTPTKSKQYYHRQNQGKNTHSSPTTSPPRGGQYRKCTPSPTSDGFKTPQNPRVNPKTLASRCASEPIKAKKKLSVTPRTSPLNFAGSKCLEPPMPTSLPRPPTTWTKVPEKKNSFSAKQTLSFDDLVGINPDLDPLSQQLKLLLNVQAWWISTDGCDCFVSMEILNFGAMTYG